MAQTDNDLSPILHKILGRGLMVLRRKAVMPRLVNSSYSMDAAQLGSTIDVPVPTAVATRAVAPGMTKPDGVGITNAIVQVSLDQWRQNDPIYLTDKELTEIDESEHYLPMQLEEAVNGLTSEANRYVLGKYLKVFQAVGTAGTTPFGSGVLLDSAVDLRKALSSTLTPKDNRRAVLDYDAEAAALKLEPFYAAEKTLSNEVIIEGEIGRKFGIDWICDDDILTHTAGTISDGDGGRTAAVNNGAGYAVGIDTININNGAATGLTGTILVGDILSFAGHDQTYAVVANASSGQYGAGTGDNGGYTASANAVGGLKIYPALQSAVADNEVITVKASHIVNMAFHRDAFAFANRPLAESGRRFSLGSEIAQVADPFTGLVLRLEVSRQHKQVVWEFDFLYGAELVRPELACRLLG